VVVLPHLVWQWAAEFRRVTDELHIFVYFGDERAGASPVSCEVIDILENNHRVFSGHRRYQKAVVIASYHTLSHRNGPQKQAEWLVKEKHDTTVDLKNPPILARADWPRSLGGLFRTVILDEAHQTRNLTSHQSVTLRWLRAVFNLLLTATPLFNSVDDFKGLAPFLLK
jgi:SNF2 family DNA or RNA helicase